MIHCTDREQAKAVLSQVIRPDSTVLVKASRGMRLEEITAKLLELTEDHGGSTVIRRHQGDLRLLEVPEEELTDVDTLQALARLKEEMA